MLPWVLIVFLDEAEGHLRLHSASDGYIFVPALLLEYLALQEVPIPSVLLQNSFQLKRFLLNIACRVHPFEDACSPLGCASFLA